MNNNTNNNNSAPQNTGPSQQDIMRKNLNQDFQNQNQNQNNKVVLGRGQNDFRNPNPKRHRRGIIGYLQRKFAPFLKWWSKARFKWEESSKRRRAWIIGILAIAVIGSRFWGGHDKVGLQVANSALASKRTFVNSDTIELTNEKYDRGNGTMRLNFVTSSNTGAVTAKDLSAKFVLAQSPKSNSAPQPTLSLIPTFNNHYIVTVHHLYKGFGGLKITFHNHAKMTVGELNQALQNNDGGPLDNLSPKQQDEISNIASSGASDTPSADKAFRLIHKIEHHDNASFIIGEVASRAHHEGHVSPYLSGYQLAMDELQHHLKRDYSAIKTNQLLIRKEQEQIKGDQGKIRDINRNADTSAKGKEVGGVSQSDQNSHQNINTYKQKIHQLQQDINLTQSRITKLKNNISILPKAKTPAKGMVFNNAKD